MELDAVIAVLLRERLRVTATAAAVVRDVHAADDVFQQVVLAALEAHGQLCDPAHVIAWALRAARHRAVDAARRRHLRTLPDDVLDLLQGPPEPGEPTGTDQGEALAGCLERLAGPARDLIRMRYDEGMSAAAIAGRLRRSVDAVYQSLSRTQRALRECVERQLVARTAAGEEART
jgi:RNA polymerase sigma factor (sigma-70 family)